MIPADTVHLWHLSIASAAVPTQSLQHVLSPDERAGLHGAAEPYRRDFVVVRSAVRAVLGAYLALPPEEVALRRGRWGKPEIANVEGAPRFNVSHAGDAALIAVAADRDVGVDVEGIRPRRDAAGLATRFFPADESVLVRSRDAAGRETVFLRLWTRKEAIVKAAGGRLAQGLRLSVAHEGRSFTTSDPTRRLPGMWWVCDLDVPLGYAAALAVSGSGPCHVVEMPAGHSRTRIANATFLTPGEGSRAYRTERIN
jgi:4'-phosphopantetheinyl transferase